MATTSSSSSSAHVRSTSWPQDLDPLSRAIEDHLLTLTQKPESSSSCYNKLGVLKNMYEVVEVLLRFQTSKTRKAFADFEDVSDGFLEVLDLCGTIRDVLMQVKEQVIELESSLRRRVIRTGGDQEDFLNREIDAYVFKRRTLSRTITKQLKRRKKKRDYGEEINVVKKVEEASFNVLVSLLVEVVEIDHKQRSRSGGIGILSRIFSKKNQEVNGEEMKKLRETEHNIEERERELECVYKKLLMIRVSLLNMHNL